MDGDERTHDDDPVTGAPCRVTSTECPSPPRSGIVSQPVVQLDGLAIVISGRAGSRPGRSRWPRTGRCHRDRLAFAKDLAGLDRLNVELTIDAAELIEGSRNSGLGPAAATLKDDYKGLVTEYGDCVSPPESTADTRL